MFSAYHLFSFLRAEYLDLPLPHKTPDSDLLLTSRAVYLGCCFSYVSPEPNCLGLYPSSAATWL